MFNSFLIYRLTFGLIVSLKHRFSRILCALNFMPFYYKNNLPSQDDSKNLTIVLFVYNESSRVQEAIISLRGYENILVVDNYSTDATIDIIKLERPDVKIVQIKNPGVVTGSVIRQALEYVETDWVFHTLVSERIPDILRRSVNNITAKHRDDIRAIFIDRSSFTCFNKTHTTCSRLKNMLAKDYLNQSYRVFKKEYFDESASRIHNEFTVKVQKKSQVVVINTLLAPAYLHHDRGCSFGNIIKKNLKYAIIESDKLIRQNYKSSLIRCLFRPVAYFIKANICSTLTLSTSRHSFIESINHAIYIYTVEILCYQKKQDH